MLSVMLSNGNVVGFGRPALLSAKTGDKDSSQEGDNAGLLEGHQAADWMSAIVGGQCSSASRRVSRQRIVNSLPSISVLAARSLRKLGAAAHEGERARGVVWNGDETLESGSMADDSTMLRAVCPFYVFSSQVRVCVLVDERKREI